jgi:hypothetical protein
MRRGTELKEWFYKVFFFFVAFVVEKKLSMNKLKVIAMLKQSQRQRSFRRQVIDFRKLAFNCANGCRGLPAHGNRFVFRLTAYFTDPFKFGKFIFNRHDTMTAGYIWYYKCLSFHFFSPPEFFLFNLNIMQDTSRVDDTFLDKDVLR